jgi:hypothetical protein
MIKYWINMMRAIRRYRFPLGTFCGLVMLFGSLTYVKHDTIDSQNKTDIVRGVFVYKPGKANAIARSYIGDIEVYCYRQVLGGGGDCAGFQEIKGVEVVATVVIVTGLLGHGKFVIELKSESKEKSFYWSQPLTNLQRHRVLDTVLEVIFSSLILSGFATIIFQKTFVKEY